MNTYSIYRVTQTQTGTTYTKQDEFDSLPDAMLELTYLPPGRYLVCDSRGHRHARVTRLARPAVAGKVARAVAVA